MLYVVGVALILTLSSFALKARRNGWRAELLETLMSAVFGLMAGVLIGFGARIGMGAIAFANGDPFRFSISGTLMVVGVFSTLGIVSGLIYGILLRDWLKQSGLAFGILLTLVSWYPLAEAAIEVLNFRPTMISLILLSGVFVALMFMPFGAALETLLSRWDRREGNFLQSFCPLTKNTIRTQILLP
jgi:hypothetical protein